MVDSSTGARYGMVPRDVVPEPQRRHVIGRSAAPVEARKARAARELSAGTSSHHHDRPYRTRRKDIRALVDASDALDDAMRAPACDLKWTTSRKRDRKLTLAPWGPRELEPSMTAVAPGRHRSVVPAEPPRPDDAFARDQDDVIARAARLMSADLVTSRLPLPTNYVARVREALDWLKIGPPPPPIKKKPPERKPAVAPGKSSLAPGANKTVPPAGVTPQVAASSRKSWASVYHKPPVPRTRKPEAMRLPSITLTGAKVAEVRMPPQPPPPPRKARPPVFAMTKRPKPPTMAPPRKSKPVRLPALERSDPASKKKTGCDVVKAVPKKKDEAKPTPKRPAAAEKRNIQADAGCRRVTTTPESRAVAGTAPKADPSKEGDAKGAKSKEPTLKSAALNGEKLSNQGLAAAEKEKAAVPKTGTGIETSRKPENVKAPARVAVTEKSKDLPPMESSDSKKLTLVTVTDKSSRVSSLPPMESAERKTEAPSGRPLSLATPPMESTNRAIGKKLRLVTAEEDPPKTGRAPPMEVKERKPEKLALVTVREKNEKVTESPPAGSGEFGVAELAPTDAETLVTTVVETRDLDDANVASPSGSEQGQWSTAATDQGSAKGSELSGTCSVNQELQIVGPTENKKLIQEEAPLKEVATSRGKALSAKTSSEQSVLLDAMDGPFECAESTALELPELAKSTAPTDEDLTGIAASNQLEPTRKSASKDPVVEKVPEGSALDDKETLEKHAQEKKKDFEPCFSEENKSMPSGPMEENELLVEELITQEEPKTVRASVSSEFTEEAIYQDPAPIEKAFLDKLDLTVKAIYELSEQPERAASEKSERTESAFLENSNLIEKACSDKSELNKKTGSRKAGPTEEAASKSPDKTIESQKPENSDERLVISEEPELKEKEAPREQDSLRVAVLRENQSVEVIPLGKQQSVEVVTLKEQQSVEVIVLEKRRSVELVSLNEPMSLEIVALEEPRSMDVSSLEAPGSTELVPGETPDLRSDAETRYLRKAVRFAEPAEPSEARVEPVSDSDSESVGFPEVSASRALEFFESALMNFASDEDDVDRISDVAHALHFIANATSQFSDDDDAVANDDQGETVPRPSTPDNEPPPRFEFVRRSRPSVYVTSAKTTPPGRPAEPRDEEEDAPTEGIQRFVVELLSLMSEHR